MTATDTSVRPIFAANPNYLAYGRDQFAANPNVWYDRYDTQATLRPVEGAVGARFRHYSGVEQGLFNNAEFEESDRVELRLDVAQEQLQEVMKQKLSRITPSPTPTTAPAKSWKPAAAQPNAARITVGAQADLPLCAMDTYVRIDGFRARVMIDYYFFNDHAQQLEGSFLMRLPDDASLNYFAFGPTTIQQAPVQPSGDSAKAAEASVPAVDLNEIAALLRKQAAGGQSADLARRAVDDRFTSESDSLYGKVKAARVVERERAALAYEETARRRVDPALVEWAGAGIFQTRVFPLLPHTLNRVVIGYDTTLQWVDKTWKLKLQVPKHAAGHVEVDLAAIGGHQVQVSPSVAPFLSGDRAYYRFDVSKYPARKVEQEKQAADADGKEPPEQQLAVYEVTIGAPDSLMLTGQDKSGPYFVVQATADVPTESAVPFPDGRAVFLLDTSWSERPEQFARWLKLLAAILTENRESLRQFQVVLFNVEQRSWRTGWVENNAAIQQELMQELESTVLEGATNLTDALTFACQLGKAEPKSEPSAAMPLLLLSDGAANWGKTDYKRWSRRFVAKPLKT